MTTSHTLQTPDGAFSIVADGDTVLASGWTDDVASLVALIHPTLRPDTVADGVPAAAVEAVEAYYAGDHAAPGRVAVRQHSGQFRTHAWEVLRGIPAGAPVSYAEYAARSGNPAAVRAAASACAFNAAALFVPCHRVLRTDGSLGGFRYGLDIKHALLVREG